MRLTSVLFIYYVFYIYLTFSPAPSISPETHAAPAPLCTTITVPAEHGDATVELYKQSTGQTPTYSSNPDTAVFQLPGGCELHVVKDTQALRNGDLFDTFAGVAAAGTVDSVYNALYTILKNSSLLESTSPPQDVTVVPLFPDGNGTYARYTLRLASLTLKAATLTKSASIGPSGIEIAGRCRAHRQRQCASIGPSGIEI